MIRVSTPGGVCDLRQWVLVDQISDEQGNETFIAVLTKVAVGAFLDHFFILFL